MDRHFEPSIPEERSGSKMRQNDEYRPQGYCLWCLSGCSSIDFGPTPLTTTMKTVPTTSQRTTTKIPTSTIRTTTPKMSQSTTSKTIKTTSKGSNCELSMTTVNGKPACKDNVIFKEDFNGDTIDAKKWGHSIYMPLAPDHEFVVFNDEPQNCYVKSGKLFMKPILQCDQFIESGILSLKEDCTGQKNTLECERRSARDNILPPVQSARINTKRYFSFKYGVVEIIAKLPQGDWIVPELLLRPKSEAYGSNYNSGIVRIAMARGNSHLILGKNDLGIRHLESGIIMGKKDFIRGREVTKYKRHGWSKDLHNFTLIWTPDNLSFMVDGEEVGGMIPDEGGQLCELTGFDEEHCDVWAASSSSIAPFDKEFYISIGISVGGIRDFPDKSRSGDVVKPWKNASPKAMYNFWKEKDGWKDTWKKGESTLEIDSIKVTSL